MHEERGEDLETIIRSRVVTLIEDHLRVREVSKATGGATVQALPRPDVIGVYVLLPKVGGTKSAYNCVKKQKGLSNRLKPSTFHAFGAEGRTIKLCNY
jgi:hypothetical protein